MTPTNIFFLVMLVKDFPFNVEFHNFKCLMMLKHFHLAISCKCRMACSGRSFKNLSHIWGSTVKIFWLEAR